MEIYNSNDLFCKDIVNYSKTHKLVKEICSKVESKIDFIYQHFDSEFTNLSVYLTLNNRMYKGKSILLLDLFKFLFEKPLKTLESINSSEFLLDVLNIKYYFYN